ncbi:MAG: gliding motility protein GldN [Candidatus Azobacteroides sp.]|nr:gliding motility protein GldN [Candidatus Azobacteroides sp.]
MKKLYCIGLICLLFAFVQECFSQNQEQARRTRPRASETPSADNTQALSERAKIKNEMESRISGHIAWLREIYRYVDLTKENNAALYYPVQPIGDRMNLFTVIFKLLADKKVPAYNYVGEREVFSEEEKINFEDILKKYEILYKTQGLGPNVKYMIDNNDIPSSEVTMYLVKENWYFDEATGTFQSRVVALCPMLIREDYYYGGETRNPLFWVIYDDIRPYISREMIMTSNYNNVLTYTIDDYFRKHMYSGDIVKTTNLMNRSLAQERGSDDPEALKQAQDSIESQLKTFRQNLWVYNDSTFSKGENAKAAKPAKEKKETRSVRGKNNEKEEKVKEQKTKSSSNKSEEKASPTRSVRRTRR